jgi:hypothetical protein
MGIGQRVCRGQELIGQGAVGVPPEFRDLIRHPEFKVTTFAAAWRTEYYLF